MAPKKKVAGLIKLQIQAGQANPAPPIGPALGLFLVGSVLCGAAPSVPALIAFRVLQGLGAGAMQPVALTVIGDLYTLEQRARVQAAFSAVWGIAGLIGPLTGGLIVKYLTWHWIFFINVPVGLGALALLAREREEPRVVERHGGPARHLLQPQHVAALVGAAGGGRGEARHHAERAAPGQERHGHDGADVERHHRLAVLLAPGDALDELSLARPHRASDSDPDRAGVGTVRRLLGRVHLLLAGCC